jgi:hypothetical protein
VVLTWHLTNADGYTVDPSRKEEKDWAGFRVTDAAGKEVYKGTFEFG